MTTDGKELRLALAMRGGVSLAVWIGGAVAEVEHFRQSITTAEPDERQKTYRRLLKAQGYEAVTVDVLAGASAGGLNAVVYAFAQSAGIDLEWLLDVWKREGDLWSLMREPWSPTGTFRVESVLSGDAGFYQAIRHELECRWNPDEAPYKLGWLTVDLSATLADGPTLKTATGRASEAAQRPSQVHFHFRRTPGGTDKFNDIPTPRGEAQVNRERISRMAYAARSTSSFPGAFEPGRFASKVGAGDVEGVRVVGKATVDAADVDVEGPAEALADPPDMSSVFSENADVEDPTFKVMDGGVFDNIPISRALAAVADAPATDLPHRVLFYLDPSPPLTTAPRPPVDRRSDPLSDDWFLRTVLQAKAYKVRQELAADEIDEIRACNAGIAEAHARRRRAFAQLNGQPDMDPDVGAQYVRYRAVLDAQRLMALLTTPGASFLRAMAEPIRQTSVVPREDAVQVQRQVQGVLEARQAAKLIIDARALTSLVTFLLAQARDQQALISALGLFKKQAYLMRIAAQYIVENEERLLVRSLLSGLDLREVTTASWPSSEPVSFSRSVLEAIWQGNEDSLWEALAATPNPARPQVGLEALWKLLCCLTKPIASDLEVPLSATSEHTIGSYGAALESLAGPPTAGVEVEFRTLTANEVTTIALPRVRRQGVRDSLSRLIGSRVGTQSEQVAYAANLPLVRADTKLAGNQFANFAGFLSADWREHDWTWGRADAAAGLLKMLGSAESEVVNAQRDVLSESGREMDVRKPRWGDLPADHRFAVVSRLLHVVLRALWPLTFGPESGQVGEGRFSLRKVARAIPLMVFRPVLVILPLLFRPAALAAVWLAVLVGERLVRENGETQVNVVRAVLLALAIWLAIQIPRLRTLRRRWNELGNAWPADEKSFVGDVTRARATQVSRALGLTAVLFAATFAATFAAFVAAKVLVGRLPLTSLELISAVLVVGGLIQYAVSGPLRRAPKEPPKTNADPVWALAGFLLGVLVTVAIVAPDRVDPIGGAGSAVVAGVACVVTWQLHQSWVTTFWNVLSVVVVAGSVLAVYSWDWLHTVAQGWNDWWGLIVLVLTPGVIFCTAWFVRRLLLLIPGAEHSARCERSARIVLVVLFGIETVVGAILVLWVFGWLQGFPLGLALGVAGSAATTLVVNVPEAVDQVVKKERSARRRPSPPSESTPNTGTPGHRQRHFNSDSATPG